MFLDKSRKLRRWLLALENRALGTSEGLKVPKWAS